MKYFYYEEYCTGLSFMVEAEDYEEAEVLAFKFVMKYTKENSIECSIYDGREIEDPEWYVYVYKVNKNGYTFVERED